MPARARSSVRRRGEPRFALVGRPNVGKSSLFNRLVGEERAVVFEEAGTTRDSVDALVEWPGAGRIRFVDTAGMRREIRVQGRRVLQLRSRGGRRSTERTPSP